MPLYSVIKKTTYNVKAMIIVVLRLLMSEIIGNINIYMKNKTGKNQYPNRLPKDISDKDIFFVKVTSIT